MLDDALSLGHTFSKEFAVGVSQLREFQIFLILISSYQFEDILRGRHFGAFPLEFLRQLIVLRRLYYILTILTRIVRRLFWEGSVVGGLLQELEVGLVLGLQLQDVDGHVEFGKGLASVVLQDLLGAFLDDDVVVVLAFAE